MPDEITDQNVLDLAGEDPETLRKLGHRVIDRLVDEGDLQVVADDVAFYFENRASRELLKKWVADAKPEGVEVPTETEDDESDGEAELVGYYRVLGPANRRAAIRALNKVYLKELREYEAKVKVEGVTP